ncbi:hypothetical protein Dpep_1413 [Dethiosulfovibrio peptidovorans DSM 11002]|uniref:Uncharacterized protein n=1 Tax=Dethiosulfovibrio peptidovorans DSM 11002 TaxID=469381 RepID=D2Z7J2_9BACT|nr:hypothetical protein [Dethiosulfovibrio peptidovorans]EFC91439.1 hypothetical protein Dpep_1413 [Dethiosulfovibrio peptidovorans DSM 11002]
MTSRLCAFLASLLLICSPAYGWDLNLPSLSLPSWITGSDSDSFSSLWDDAMGELDDALGRLDEAEYLPDERLIGNDRSKNDRKIDSVLEDVVEILGDSEAANLRAEITTLRERISSRRAKLASLQERRVSAPSEGGLLNRGKDDLDEAIESETEAMVSDERTLASLEDAFVSAMKKSGLNGSDESIRGMLAGVTADDIVAMQGVYLNVRLFADNLTELMESASDDISVAKRYYGIYALLIRTCLVMNERFVEKIENRYIPELNDMESSAEGLAAEMEAQMDDPSLTSSQRALLRSNLDSTAMTLRAIEAYREYLEEQRDFALKNVDAFGRDYGVAYNAYRTMRLARGLLDLVKANRKDFDALASLEIPDVVVFSNDRLKKEFIAITEGLKN